MKKLLGYTLIAIFAAVAAANAAPDAAALEAKEKEVWQAVKDKKMDAFKDFLSPDMQAVYVDGAYTRDKEVEAVAKIDMKSFALSDFVVTMPNKDTAIVSYTAKIEGSADGKDTSGTYYAGSVWQMKDGKWHAIFHSDMKAQDAMAPDAQKKE